MSIYNPFQVIYKITNHTNDKVYIGSTVNVYERQYTHTRDLLKNKHSNQKLQNSWNKYGWKAFSFQIIEHITDQTMLLKREQYYVDQYNSLTKGYNCIYPEPRLTAKGIEERSQQKKDYYIKNKEAIKQQRKEYRLKNERKIKQLKKSEYVNNKEKIKARVKEYALNNKEKIKEKKKQYRDDNKELIKNKRNQYREQNADQIKLHKKEYYDANKDEINERRRARRAEKKALALELKLSSMPQE